MSIQSKKQQLIILTAGGTGGHVFPAQALAEAITDKYQLNLITDIRGVEFIKGSLSTVPKTVLSVKGLAGSVNDKLYALSSMMYYFVILSFKFFFQRPALVVGFGGYPSVPAIIAAYVNRIPIIVHEQNAVMGRANRFLAKMADKIAISFENTQMIPDGLEDKLIYTGNPIRRTILEVLDKKITNRDKTSFTILIIGGSQGAAILSKVVPAAIKLLPTKIQDRLLIYQQVREDLIQNAKKVYLDTNAKVELKGFFDNIAELIFNSDLIISRSGAASIMEIIATQKPSILVPLPSSQNNHQLFNAKFLSDKKAAILLEESDLSPDSLAAELMRLIKDKKLLGKIKANLADIKLPNTINILADLVDHTAIK